MWGWRKKATSKNQEESPHRTWPCRRLDHRPPHSRTVTNYCQWFKLPGLTRLLITAQTTTMILKKHAPPPKSIVYSHSLYPRLLFWSSLWSSVPWEAKPAQSSSGYLWAVKGIGRTQMRTGYPSHSRVAADFWDISFLSESGPTHSGSNFSEALSNSLHPFVPQLPALTSPPVSQKLGWFL